MIYLLTPDEFLDFALAHVLLLAAWLLASVWLHAQLYRPDSPVRPGIALIGLVTVQVAMLCGLMMMRLRWQIIQEALLITMSLGVYLASLRWLAQRKRRNPAPAKRFGLTLLQIAATLFVAAGLLCTLMPPEMPLEALRWARQWALP